jgi:hypothetical protein
VVIAARPRASFRRPVLAFLAAAVVGFLACGVAGRTGQGAGTAAAAGAAGPAAEADRMRLVLPAAVNRLDGPSPLSPAFTDDLLEVTGGGIARDFETARDHAIIRILRSEGIRRQELLGTRTTTG